MLSQVQIIRSLGEALAWFEKEIDWGAPIAELRHLTGRIGELYAAMLTQGQMAAAVNQPGYDVVGAGGERVSVKTVTTSSRVPFNKRTLDLVDRVIIFRIAVDDEVGVSIATLLDVRRDEFDRHFRQLASGEIDYPVRSAPAVVRPLIDQAIVAEGRYGDWVVRQFESGSIGVWRGEAMVPVVKPALRELAGLLDVSLLNANDRPKNTRQLGAGVIGAMAAVS